MKLSTGILLLFAAWVPAAQATPPVVYEDESITVRAAVAEAGTTAVHVGDALTLVLEVVFDPDEVQIETLNADWFGRAFSDTAAFSLYRSGEPSTSSDRRGGLRVNMQWQFQVVGCPQGLSHCPGAKQYELPLAGLGYRLLSARDRSAASRSARFRPWPGSLTVVPSIPFAPEGDTGIAAVMPGGAWPTPKTSGAAGGMVGTVMVAAGGILLASGFIAGNRRRRLPHARVPHAHPDSRWERAALRLSEDTLGDEAWSDLLRRCLAWYCLDELGRNPVEWLRRDGQPPPEPPAADCRALFLDILAEPGIEVTRRGAFRARFARATGSGMLLQ